MTDGKPYLPWPGADDRIVIEEMLRDGRSGQWYECREFVKKRVQIQAKNIPQEQWDDLVQNAMARIAKFLPAFQYQCTFRTWLFGLVRSCIIDEYRKLKRVGQFLAPVDDSRDDAEHEDDAFATNTSKTVEDECIIREELRKALVALQEYVSTHANPRRNGQILNMAIFENRSFEEVAKVVGCSAAVVGYIVRSAQRYAREKSRGQG
jgi:RNA polymerase sigma factor (sigma-70 family)